jgi:hypothetical protein
MTAPLNAVTLAEKCVAHAGAIASKPRETGDPTLLAAVDPSSDQAWNAVGVSGLPPVRLHDLRHGAATLMLLFSINLKIHEQR